MDNPQYGYYSAHTNFIKYCFVTLTNLGKRSMLVSENSHKIFYKYIYYQLPFRIKKAKV